MIYGVYIWKNKLFVIDTLELGSEYPVLELQLDAEGFDQLLDMHVFQSIFKQIYDNIGLKESDGLVIAYPDSYGIWERGIIYHNAKKQLQDVCTMLTAALRLYIQRNALSKLLSLFFF